jgi:hypothetical protein
MDSLITAAARALAAGPALKRVALRDDAPALALRGIATAQPAISFERRLWCEVSARSARCKALEPNPAGRRWLERKAALLVTS